MGDIIVEAVETKTKSGPKPKEYVTKSELLSILDDKLGEVVDLLKASKPAEPVKVDTAAPDSAPIPPDWRKLCNEILGEDFGLFINYPKDGMGYNLTVIVPLSKSNAAEDYLAQYHFDRRTIALSGAEGVSGVKEWFERIRNNLNRTKSKPT